MSANEAVRIKFFGTDGDVYRSNNYPKNRPVFRKDRLEGSGIVCPQSSAISEVDTIMLFFVGFSEVYDSSAVLDLDSISNDRSN